MFDVRWQAGAYLLASLGLWLAGSQLSSRPPQIPWLRRWLTGRRAGLLRGVYMLGFPYITLVLGVVPSSRLGLAGLGRLQAIDSGSSSLPGLSQLGAALSWMVWDWLPDAGLLASRVAGLGLLLAVAWLGYGLFRRQVMARRAMVADPTGTTIQSEAIPPPDTPPSLIEAGYQVLHWSFYRGILWLLTDDLYLAAIGGVAVVGLEWALTPGWRNRLRDASWTDGLLWQASRLIANAVLFCYVPNLWLLIPVHWLLAVAIRGFARFGPNAQRSSRQKPTTK